MTIILNTREWLVELTHPDAGAGSWIVRCWKKQFLWFKKRISSDWFLDKDQAYAFVEKLKNERKGVR